MVVAVTIWGNRISPVFDSSSTLLIVEIEKNRIIKRSRENFSPDFMNHLEKRLKELNVSTIICGAITDAPAQILEEGGFLLVPFISGFADDVIDNIMNEKPITPQFLMPGCRKQKRSRRRGSKKIIG